MQLLKKSLWVGLALITCPCHIAIFIPILAGTTLGAYLAEYKTFTIILFTLLFSLSLFMILNKKKSSNRSKDDCCAPIIKGGDKE